ncbi:MAG: FAD:protein FMN transferase [Clostridiales Family XIII bacterium]|jgi:thiamine biosynthesis lipoprotein|nr:FAD:protein FMN transferase [Clostridiales Family XIII bacterium]
MGMITNRARFCALAAVLMSAALAVACSTQGASPPESIAGEGAQGSDGKAREASEPISRIETGYLGTVISIAIYDQDFDGPRAEALLDECFEAIEGIDGRMSVNSESSEVSEINRNSGGDYTFVSDELYGLIEEAIAFSERSGGAFDISVGPVMDLWKVGGEFARLPSPEEVQEKLPLVGYGMIELMPPNGVRLPSQGMKLDLGAIAKGYACDRVTAALRDAGIRHAIVDMGGNIYVVGSKPDGTDWRVGIRTPLVGESGIVCSLSLSDATAVTSGGYENFFEEGGRLYNHLIDTKTGYPADSGLLSVTVVASSSGGADGYSTSCFILGLEQGMALLQGAGLEGVFITEDKEIYVTPGLEGAVKIVDERFVMAQ